MKLRRTISVSLLLLFLTSCGGTIQETRNGKLVLLSNPLIWELLNENQLSMPLKKFYGRDILTEDTARDIKDNNDILND